MAKLVHSGIELNYIDAGESDFSVVLVHGLGANQAFWYPIVTGLVNRGYRVITYDLRGHGYSSRPAHGYRLGNMVDDLEMLVRHLGLTHFHLVGHSFGARVALLYALQYPERLQSLVIADTQLRALQLPVRLRDWQHWPRWREELAAQGFDDLPDEDEFISFKLLSRFSSAPRNVTMGQRAVRRPSLRHRDMGQRGGQRWRELLSSPEIADELEDETPLQEAGRLQSLRVPTLLAFGEYSHCMPTGMQLKQMFPQAELSIIPAAGHFFPAVRPKLFLAHLLKHLGANSK